MRIFWILALTGLFTAPVSAGGLDSAYTKLKVAECQKGESNDDEGWATWTCRGYKGIPIYFAHGDLREFVGYGPNAKETCSARTTFHRFNAAGSTIEWRLRSGQPVATIFRFTLDGDGKKEQFLVATKLDGNQACPMGYVDARIKNHNQAARNLVDQNYASFTCGQDAPIVVSRKYTQAKEFVSGHCDPSR